MASVTTWAPLAGIIANKFGPSIGGLFLAFPAIFPASATLIEKYEKQKKEKEGLRGTQRGRQAASVDAAGAAMGSIGLSVLPYWSGNSCLAIAHGWCSRVPLLRGWRFLF